MGVDDHPADPYGFTSLDMSWLRAKPGVKWHRSRGANLAAWVADMDFPPPGVVLDSLRSYLAAGDLGYPDFRDGTGLRELFAARMATRHGWSPDPAHVREICDVVQGVRLAVHLGSAPGDGIAFHTPSYPPFLATARTMDRPFVPIRAVRTTEGWSFDVDRFRHDLRTQPCRVLVLCNPHNPTGRVLTRVELEDLAEIALAHDMVVVSDEIHAELVYAPNVHVPFASLSDDVAARTITLSSATKAFNLAAVRCAVVHFGHAGVRDAFDAAPVHLYGAVSPFGVFATAAAWTEGDDWQRAVVARLDANRQLVSELLAGWPALAATDYAVPEATYLAWLDFRATGGGDEPAAVFSQAGIELSPGVDFGEQGTGFARLNFATSPGVLAEVVRALALALAPAR